MPADECQRITHSAIPAEFPDDWYTNQKGDGYYAKYWFLACIIIMALNDVLSLGAIYGVWIESSRLIMISSALMFVVAVYGAWDKYMKESYSAFVVPLATGNVLLCCIL